MTRTYFLTTARLALGHWEQEDEPLAVSLWGDPRVSAFIGGPFTGEEVRARLSREMQMMSAVKVQYWPVFVREGEELAGCAGLRPYCEGVLELGFHFRPQYWGRGLAEEAARAVIAYGFDTLGVESIFAGHHPDNVASQRLLTKLGFRYTHDDIYPPTGLLNHAYRLERSDGPDARPTGKSG